MRPGAFRRILWLFVELSAVDAYAIEDVRDEVLRVVRAVAQDEALGSAEVELDAKQGMVVAVLAVGDLGDTLRPWMGV